MTQLLVGDAKIPITPPVKGLDDIINSTLSFDQQVNSTCRIAYHHITALHHYRNCIDDATDKTLASCLIGASLGYCNSLLNMISHVIQRNRNVSYRPCDLEHTSVITTTVT